MSEKIKVLIVDDSAVVRQALRSLLAHDPKIEVIGAAADPYIAAQRMKIQAPDVIVLDVAMPRMDGLTFLKKIMNQHPIPVVICSELAENGQETTLKALEYGAVEIVQKPRLDTTELLETSGILIRDAVKAAAVAKLERLSIQTLVAPKLSADVMLDAPVAKARVDTTDKIIVIGASTGGTEALRVLLTSLPPESPGVVVVQHMPEHFTAAFAKRLNRDCCLTVKEAADGDSVVRGQVLIAPGNKHLLLKRTGADYFVEVKDGPLVCRHRPSVDVLFRSASRYAAKNAIGVIMTGMGDDGARGLSEMKEAGAATIAQDENSCVVFGMPKAAIARGAADKVLPLPQIGQALIRLFS